MLHSHLTCCSCETGLKVVALTINSFLGFSQYRQKFVSNCGAYIILHNQNEVPYLFIYLNHYWDWKRLQNQWHSLQWNNFDTELMADCM